MWIFRQLISRYFREGISRAAAELSYFRLFSLCPLLMFLSAVLAQINLSDQSIYTLTQLLPTTVQVIIHGYLNYVSAQPVLRPMLIGTLLTLYFVSRAVRSLMRTVNQLYRVPGRQGLFGQVFLSLVLTCGLLLSIIGTLALVVFGRTAFRMLRQWFPVPEVITNGLESVSMPVALSLVFLFVLLVNKLLPNVQLRWRQVLPGALFSCGVWVGISVVFSFYVDNIARYSLLYGSLGTIIILMLWLYLTSISLLLGPLLNHTLILRSNPSQRKEAVL